MSITLYRTSSFKDEHRIVQAWRAGFQFTECEHCKMRQSMKMLIGIKYYHRFGLILCDRCVDKCNSVMNDRDIDEYWEDKDAIKCGYPKFPLPAPPVIEQNRLEELTLRDEKYDRITTKE